MKIKADTKIGQLPQSDKIKLIAFLVSFKNISKNSVIPECKQYILSKKIGISPALYSKYFHLAENNGLIKKQGKSRKQVIALRYILNVVLPGYGNSVRFIRFWKKVDSVPGKYKEVLHSLEKGIAFLNFEQQQYCLDKVKSDYDLIKNRDKGGKLKRVLKRRADSWGCSMDEACKRILIEGKKKENYIKTGSKYLSKIIGVSQTKANNLLREWCLEGLISRETVILGYRSYFSDSSYCYTSGKHVYNAILGSKILLLYNLNERIESENHPRTNLTA